MAIRTVQMTADGAVWIDLRDRGDLVHSFDLSREDAVELHKELEMKLYDSEVQIR